MTTDQIIAAYYQTPGPGVVGRIEKTADRLNEDREKVRRILLDHWGRKYPK